MDELGTPTNSQNPPKPKRKPLPTGSAVQIVRLESGISSRGSRNLRLNTQVLRELLSKADDYPIASIVIAGPSRRGKSLMLTYIVRYLQALEWSEDGVANDWMDKANPDKSMKDKGFTFRHGMDSMTDGIWMWSKPFIVKNSKSELPIAVLVMDTEGCFDPYTNEQEQSSIIGLSLLLSSCFIYNDSGLINENTITTLAQFMQYGQVASQSFDGKAFQRLMFLIRDWATAGFEHGAAGGQGFIRRCLDSNPRMSEQANKNRQLIVNNFEDYNAYLMPFPGKKVISEDFTGSIGEMKEEFRNHVEKFVSNLMADVAPKMFGNIVACKTSFFDTFDKFAVAFNAEDMPSPASILEVTVYIALDAQIRKLTEQYETQFQKKIESKNVPFFSAETLQKYHDKYKDTANKKFAEGRRLGSVNDHQVFAEKLDQLVGHTFAEINKRNTIKQQEFVENVQQSLLEKLQNFIEQNITNKSKIWSQSEFESTIAPVTDEITHEFSNGLDGTANSFIQQQLSIFKSKLEEASQKYWLELEEKKLKAENQATKIVNKMLSNYTTNMNMLVADDILLNQSQLQILHEKHKTRRMEEASNEMNNVFLDPDFIQRFYAQLEKDINANFEPVEKKWKKQIDGILSFMDEDMQQIVADFTKEIQEELEHNPSLDNPNLGKIFSNMLDVGVETLDRLKHPGPNIVSAYRRQLKIDMELVLQEIKISFLQSPAHKYKKCKIAFETTSETFLKAINNDGRCCCNDLMTELEVESMVGQITQKILPKYEQTIRETIIEGEDSPDFLKRFDQLVIERTQELISHNLVKIQQLDKAVYDKIDSLTEAYNQEMKIQENNWTKLTNIASSHSTVMLELSQRLQAETPLHLYPKHIPKYQYRFEKEIQKYYEIHTTLFEQNVRQRDKIVHQMIPGWKINFRNEIQNHIRDNPFANKSGLALQMEQRIFQFETKLKEYAFEVNINSLIKHQTMSVFVEETSKLKTQLIDYATDVRKTTDKNVECIIQSCLQFADSHSIFHENPVIDFSVCDETLEKLKADVRGYYDSKWPFPVNSSAQEKVKTWERILKEILSKIQALGDELGKSWDRSKQGPEISVGEPKAAKSVLATAVLDPGSSRCNKKDMFVGKKYKRESGTDAFADDLSAFPKVSCDASNLTSGSLVEFPSNATPEIQGRRFSLTDSSCSSSETQSTYEDPVVEQALVRLSPSAENPELSSHRSDEKLSKPMTLSKKPVAARSAGYRTRFSLEMKANPIRHIVDHVAAPQEVMRPALTKQDFIDVLVQKLRNLSTQQLAEQSAEICFSELQSKLLPSRLAFADFRSLLENTFCYLKSHAISWEKLFVDHICLPDTIMETHLEQYRKIQIPQDLPSELRTIMRLRIQDYAKEYKARNAEIQGTEGVRIESLIRKEADCYADEMKLAIVNNSFSADVLTHLHDVTYEKTLKRFLSSAALKHEHWENRYKGIHAEKIDREWKICIDLNNNNRRFLYSELQRVKEDCVNNYKISVDAEKVKREFNPKASMAPETFNNVGATAREEATRYFEKEVDLKIGNQNKQIIQVYREQFQNDINRLFKTEQKKILDIQQQVAELLKQKELVSKKVISQPEVPEQIPRGRGGLFWANISKNANVEPGCSRASVPVPIVRGLPPSAVTLLPTFHLAIHFGLNRTRAGIYLPGTDKFQLYADVENCLYFEDEELLIQGSKNKNVRINNPETSFKSFILDHPINKVHQVHVHGKLHQFRIEDFMSYLFANLKWRVERQLLATCPNCVICVPQCLNDIQRQAIKDATTLAGFYEVRIINDTNAIALAYAMQNRSHVGDTVAVNTSEGFIDAAYFALEKGLIIRKAMSGKYFTPQVEPSVFSIAYWSKDQAIQENINNVLKFKEVKKNEKVIRCDSNHLVIVGSGEDARKVASVMSQYYQQTDCLDEEFPILGVAAFARLQDFKFQKCDDPICKVWLERGPSDKLGERIQKFKGYLLSPGTNCNKLFLNCPTTTKGVNLSVGVVQGKMLNFFLKQSREFHLVIMDILLFAMNLKPRIAEGRGLSDVKIQFLQRTENIITKIQNLQRTVDGFSTCSKLKQELESMDARFFEVID